MRRRFAVLLAAAPLAGCAVPQPPPSPDPIRGGARLEGGLGDADPAQAAFCVSRDVPLSTVALTSDGAAVRPAPGTRAEGEPDYALVVRRPDGEAKWVRQVADADPSAVALAAYRLDRALSGCAYLAGNAAR